MSTISNPKKISLTVDGIASDEQLDAIVDLINQEAYVSDISVLHNTLTDEEGGVIVAQAPGGLGWIDKETATWYFTDSDGSVVNVLNPDSPSEAATAKFYADHASLMIRPGGYTHSDGVVYDADALIHNLQRLSEALTKYETGTSNHDKDGLV